MTSDATGAGTSEIRSTTSGRFRRGASRSTSATQWQRADGATLDAAPRSRTARPAATAAEKHDPHAQHEDEESDEPERCDAFNDARGRFEEAQPASADCNKEAEPPDPTRHRTGLEDRDRVERYRNRPAERVAGVV